MARTRSESAHLRVLEAALELVAENGIEATSMDAIARRSGVSKATVYNHWQDKEALLLEMLAHANGLRCRPTFDTGNTRADMLAVLKYKPAEDGGIRRRLTPHLIAYSAKNEEFGMAWRNMVMEPPRRELRRLMESGIAKGELTPDLNFDSALAILLGPMLYWHIFLRKDSQDNSVLAEAVVHAFWSAFSAEGKEHCTTL